MFQRSIGVGRRDEFHEGEMFMFVDVDRCYFTIFTEQMTQVRFTVVSDVANEQFRWSIRRTHLEMIELARR